jgi:hypothetical protein
MVAAAALGKVIACLQIVAPEQAARSLSPRIAHLRNGAAESL